MIKEVQLRTALHGYETAVRFLKEESWPKDPVLRDMVELFFAQSLLIYHSSYSWEINRRERVEAKGPIDLKAWTKDQIFQEAWNSLMKVWKDRDHLEDLKAKDFPDFWNPGDYPVGIRDTLRDAVAYLMANILADTDFWTPRESNETYLLDLDALMERPADEKTAAIALLDAAVHPLERLCALLGEHESWCRKSGRTEAALEARLERLRALNESFRQEDDRARIRKSLADSLDRFRSYPWWAWGQALLAEFTREADSPDALVQARKLALQGAGAYPNSPGGQRCLHIVKNIESPEFSIEAMRTDAPGRRSVRATHRNMGSLFFRAYPVDLMERIRTSKDYSLFPGWREAQQIIERSRPAAAWSIVLPPTPDYWEHQTYADLPAGFRPGLYLVAASAREDFSKENNRIQGVNVIVGDIVLLKRGTNEGDQDVLVLSGETGKPVSEVRVDLYAYDWQKGHARTNSLTTDAQGRVHFASGGKPTPYFLLASKGNDITLDPDYLYLYGRSKPGQATAALIYTDRSIYRPGQKLYWKVLSYQGRTDLGRLLPAANASTSVWLEDINGERVAEATKTTNSFGTASGEFVIPAAGRPLGAWRLRSSPNGLSQIRVEEYKRPTFEVAIKDPDKPLRLNRPAVLKSEARYYFGLPVSSGQVVWQVKREPVYPRWWWRTDGDQGQIVSGGRGRLKEDGSFEMNFTPAADERKAKPDSGLSYRYTLSVDITDEGGETRSASRSFRLGFVNIEASLVADSGFFRKGTECSFTINRVDLNGVPKPGRGTWRIVRLIQPKTTLLPSEQPLPESPNGGKPKAYQTPGDLLRPRWEQAPPPETILRLWKEGAEAAGGPAEHGANGAAKVKVGALDPGAYRLLYETQDDFGAASKDSLDFLVAGERAAAELPLVLSAERASVQVGGTARLLIHSGWSNQPLLFETFKGGEVWDSRWLDCEADGGVLEIPVMEELRGGFGARLSTLKDHQFISQEAQVFVPWDNKLLDIAFSSFRNKLSPGGRETWRVTVKTPGGRPAVQGAAEILAYMYDRSLDLFAPYNPPRVANLYPWRARTIAWDAALGTAIQAFLEDYGLTEIPPYPVFQPDYLLALGGYGIGGPGGRRFAPAKSVEGRVVGGVAPSPESSMKEIRQEVPTEEMADKAVEKEKKPAEAPAGAEQIPMRSSFAETAFWQPHLLTGPDGSAAIEFTVPDSVTSWRVFIHAVTKDLMGGSLENEARTIKELMVRPYLPLFFREGDRAELKVMINNAGETELSGSVALEVFDPATNENLGPAFGLPEAVSARPFTVKPGGGTAVVFTLAAPARVGTVAFKVTAKAGGLTDGESRPLPVLPGRMHLVQSRFATLKEGQTRELAFSDLASDDDPSRIHEQLLVTIDAQLFYGLLEALPYLVNYPYECTEQTLNRFLSTGILTGLYDKYPQVARMAEALSKRETAYESFDAADANRKMALEETPWLTMGRGGKDEGFGVEKVLDPRVARAQRETSLAKLIKAQTSLGAFPWWPGGPPSPYMTLYIVHGFSKALEFRVAVPKDPVVRAFAYLHQHYLDEIVEALMALDVGWEFVTFLNYALSNFPDASWTGGVFTDAERTRMLDFSFRHWKAHSPYLKGFLALTLKRAGRPKDATLVWDSVMDSAKTTVHEGTSWAPEDRGWLWYNDAIETHAFALRTLMELNPEDARSEGLVQWLFLNKKLNHWKSTRATAEVIYSVAYFLKTTGALGVRESVLVDACHTQTTFLFEPDKYTGKKNQVLILGDKIGPDCATVRVRKEGKGMAFASATWHFSTERLPEKGEDDLFGIERTYFRRLKRGDEVVLKPLADGEPLAVGDELEVQLSIRARHPAEYVHLRDPRPSGCEPATLTSGTKWDLGLVRYEEIRDSGTNFFMEGLPQGEYTLKYRLRCAMAGAFKVSPATLQSMYAPEFAAYSAGHVVTIRPE